MENLVKNGLVGNSFNAVFGIVGIIVCVIIPYLLGSINFAVIISKNGYKDDVRTHGSGNAGATNMLRVHGKGAAALTFLGDFLKSAISTFLALLIMPGDEFAYIAAFFCILGHAYPIFFKFKGGKGVVVTAAAVLILNPLVFLICIAVFILIVLSTKYVSLGSIIAAILFPILNFKLFAYSVPMPIKTIFSVLIALFIIFLHRKNIVRLFNGTESKFGKNKPQKLK